MQTTRTGMVAALGAFAAIIGGPVLASADLLADGTEFQVNTYTTGGQYGSTARSVARAPDGSFVVVWWSFGDRDGNYQSVHGQRYDSAGAAAGTEFQVNTYTTNTQYNPAVSAAADGSFVVVWESYGQDGSGPGVFGQRYDSVGAAAGTEFQVNSYTTDEQYHPAVSAAADGSFVVVWQSNGQDGGVQGQRYDNTGAAAGTEFQVNSHTTGFQGYPAVSAAVDGGFVVVWDSYDSQDGSYTSVQGQRYDNTGAVVGTEFQVNSYTTGGQGGPTVSTAADGSFVVVWISYGQDGSGQGVFGQRYDSVGAAVGSEFQVNSYTTYTQVNPEISVAPDGGFVVVWASGGQDGSGYSVQGQRYDSAGATAGTEFQVNSYTTGSQGYWNSIAVDADGDFVVAWGSPQDGSGYGVFAQLLCQDANSNSVCDSQEVTTGCAASPATDCITGTKASFQLKDNADDTKDQLKWKLGKGGAFDQTLLGDPTTTRAYTLCIYDETAGSPSLVGTLKIDPNASWADKDPKGYSYVDKAGAEDGVTKAALRAGDAGKTGASVSAKGTNIPMPTPTSGTEYFNQDTALTVQLVNNETATCWTSEFTTATKNDGVQFKAKVP